MVTVVQLWIYFLKNNKLYNLNGLILWYMIYMSIKLLERGGWVGERKGEIFSYNIYSRKWGQDVGLIFDDIEMLRNNFIFHNFFSQHTLNTSLSHSFAAQFLSNVQALLITPSVYILSTRHLPSQPAVTHPGHLLSNTMKPHATWNWILRNLSITYIWDPNFFPPFPAATIIILKGL